jgi:hypothetical protein
MDWQTTIQSWGSQLVDRWSAAEWVQPYEVQKMQFQALGQGGYYTEGQPNRARVQPGGEVVVTPGALLIFGALAVVLLMSKD